MALHKPKEDAKRRARIRSKKSRKANQRRRKRKS